MEDKKKIYQEILDVITKHKDIVPYEISRISDKLELYLWGIELYEKYGLLISEDKISNKDYIIINDYLFLGMYGEKYNRTISWLDSGNQPEDELLLDIGFSTGAYIFGKDYPVELFREFFNELKTYNPKYTDSHNNSLYFSMDNAAKMLNAFQAIIDKYHEKNRTDSKLRKIKKLQEELEKLTT